METSIRDVLQRQFLRVFETWRSYLDKVLLSEWRQGSIDYLIPVRHFCHNIETMDFYTGNVPVDKYAWGHLYDGEDWEGSDASDLPDKAQSLILIDRVQAMVEERFSRLTDADLLAPETLFPWTGGTRLDSFLYLLRHMQHHIGEMQAELWHRNIPRAEWR